MIDELKVTSLLPKLNAPKAFDAKAFHHRDGFPQGEAGWLKKDTGRRGTDLRIAVLENYAYQRIHRLVDSCSSLLLSCPNRHQPDPLSAFPLWQSRWRGWSF